MAEEEIVFVDYSDESMLADIQKLVSKDLSEPYSIYTYRYFLHSWPNLCICAYSRNREDPSQKNMIATIVCKMEESGDIMQGYIAMLTVDENYRKKGLAMRLVTMGIDRMIAAGCQEVMLETEASNLKAQNLYRKLGFAKDDKMCKYYLNGGDAYRLKLWIDKKPPPLYEDHILTAPTSVV